MHYSPRDTWLHRAETSRKRNDLRRNSILDMKLFLCSCMLGCASALQLTPAVRSLQRNVPAIRMDA